MGRVNELIIISIHGGYCGLWLVVDLPLNKLLFYAVGFECLNICEEEDE